MEVIPQGIDPDWHESHLLIQVMDIGPVPRGELFNRVRERQREKVVLGEKGITHSRRAYKYWLDDLMDNQNAADETPQEDSLVDDGSLDMGIVAGIMYALREKKTRIKAAHVGDVGFEFLEQLRRTFIEIGKLFGTGIYSRYREKLPNLGQAYEEIDRVLDEARQG